jgi:hypothetical protein
MRNLILSALILASAFQTALGQTYTSGDYQYTVSNNQVTIYNYAGSGGAVSIPSRINSYPVVSIGSYAFAGSALTSVIIPNSVTSIRYGAFASCSSLASVNIPNSVTSIEEGAFGYCPSLTSVTIPNSVTSIGNQVFDNCHSLASITIPNSVTSIGRSAFYNCHSLASITIPNSVTSIGSSAFSNCQSLTSITIPNSVTSIGNEAFLYCTTLSSVYLPVRFEATYQNFGLTSAQVILYDETNPASIYLAGQQSVINNPSAHNLYTATQYTANFNAGKDSILNSPNSNGLYTTSQIQYMTVGSLFLTRQASGDFVLNCDLEQSTDLQNWTTYQSFAFPLTGFPSDKAFVRFKAKE